jgi:predicted exporter
MSRPLLIAAWLAGLLLLAGLGLSNLKVSGDLRMFMPAAQTDSQRLLLQLVGQGPGARLLLVALGGAPAETLAGHSIELAERLRQRPEFARVANGDDGLDAFDQALLPYRYLLSPTLDETALDAAFLRAELSDRLHDLASPAAGLVEPWIPRDPSLELLRLAERWRPAAEPERIDGVWFSADGERALLLLETVDGGFDPPAQRAALDAIGAAVAALEDGPDGSTLQLEISGPGAFSVLLHDRTRGEASRLGTTAALGILLILAVAYRSLRLPLLGALPLATAALAALAAVALLFGEVHGITLAFGFTLLGLAQDYPVHLFSHLRPAAAAGERADATVRRLWPTLATGATSTCVAYLSFALAGVAGLQQLAVFAITGLLVAALATRWLLPALLPAPARELADAPALQALWRRVSRLPRGRRWLLLPALLACAALLLSERPLWDDRLGSLTPVPAELLARDGELRAELGAADVRHLLVLEAADHEGLLQASEALEPALQALVEAGAIDAFELPSHYLPSRQHQLRRQAGLPTPDRLAAALETASAGLPFKRDLFAPFLADVEAARTLPPLTPADLADSPLGVRLQALLPEGEQAIALISLVGLDDPAALARLAERHGDRLSLLDLKAASESLSSLYRERVLWALAGALLLLLLALRIALGGAARTVRVLAPMLLASLFTVAVLHAAGVGFTLFHLVSLVLAAGLGLDYALFFERAGGDRAEQRRTLHAVLVCVTSTVLVFGLLASSSIPVLRAIGLSVSVGVLLQCLLAAMLANRGADDAVA